VFAFGNTLEALTTRVLGHEARGSGSPLDRHTGAGFISAKDGDYADALAKGHHVHLLVTESTGAMCPALIHLLLALSRCVKLPGACDTTVYGTSRASHRDFFPHHLAAISSAIVFADANTLSAEAAHLNYKLTTGAA